MPTRLRKVRKRRGSRTHGWGQIGQHRKTGAKGGRGMAGGHKHKWTKLLKTDYFGKYGFVPVRRKIEKTVDLMTVSSMAAKTGSETINLSEFGIDKLLGSGKLDRPLKIVVNRWSRKAQEKVEQAGGKVVKPQGLTAS